MDQERIFKNSIWSFDQDKPITAEHDGSVVVLDHKPSTEKIAMLLASHDRVATPSSVHDRGGAYDRRTGESL